MAITIYISPVPIFTTCVICLSLWLDIFDWSTTLSNYKDFIWDWWKKLATLCLATNIIFSRHMPYSLKVYISMEPRGWTNILPVWSQAINHLFRSLAQEGHIIYLYSIKGLERNQELYEKPYISVMIQQAQVWIFWSHIISVPRIIFHIRSISEGMSVGTHGLSRSVILQPGAYCTCTLI